MKTDSSSLLRKGINLLSSVIIVVRSPERASLLQRMMSHISFRRKVQVSTIKDAEREIMKKQPKAVVIDVSDCSSAEYGRSVEPFVLSLPGWIRTLLIDTQATPPRVQKAAENGVHGVLTDISRRHLTAAFSAESKENKDKH